ncbi:MAG TPA: flagellar biosynthetic protein FliR [Fibrobacteria bacterium]|nr:flagellar biosynthetic protein FliR [Fibrobacteria bacterium]
MTQVPIPTALDGVPGLQDFTVAQIELWLLVLIRVSVLVFLTPIFSTDEVPARVKASVAFFLSLILFPALPHAAVAIPSSLPAYMMLAIKEIYIGAVMGFAGTFVFAGLRFAGSWIDAETGFNMTQIINPVAQEEDTPLGHLLFILFILLLLSTGGYMFYLQAIAESFRLIPLAGAQAASGNMVAVFVQLSTNAFLLGLKVAAPVVTTLFVSSIGLAVIARIMPQMNVWMVGMPMKLALGTLTMIFSLPLMWQAFLKEQESLQGYWIVLMRMMGA